MKVANIIEEGRLGGPQIRITEVSKLLREHGIKTIVFLPNHASGAFQEKLNQAGVPFVVSPLHKLSRSKKDLLIYFLAFPYEVVWLIRKFRQLQVEIVHSSGGAWQYKGVIAGRLAGIRTVWHLNDTSLPRLLHITFRFVVRHFADGFIVAAKRVGECYLGSGLGRQNVTEIQAPVDTQKFNLDLVVPDKAVSAMPGIKILAIGNLNSIKGFEYLLEAVRLIRDTGFTVTAIIVGDTFENQRAYKDKLESYIRTKGLDCIHFMGSVKDVRSILAAADIYVCSSNAEASPIAVWEAMSMAKPIVSTDVGDVPRFVRHGESGYIVPTRNPGEIAEHVIKLARNKAVCKEFGKKAREIAINHLDINVVVRLHEECYRKLLLKK